MENSLNHFISNKYCINCGKNGHLLKECKEPIISIGIICIKCKDIQLTQKLKDDFQGEVSNYKSYLNIIKQNQSNINALKYFGNITQKLEFLLIQRKHSLGYIEFIRGRYTIENYRQIIHLFEQMTMTEIDKIRNYNFDDLWNDLWDKTSASNVYQQDYIKSKEKFEMLKTKEGNDKYFSLDFYLSNILPKWSTAEWGFPKGRRAYKEGNIKCAIREFYEESGISSNKYTILNKISPIKEVFKGTNGVTYKLIYFLAILNDDVEIPYVYCNEIGDIGWFNYNTCMTLIRDYHIEKKKCLNEIVQFISSRYGSNLS